MLYSKCYSFGVDNSTIVTYNLINIPMNTTTIILFYGN